jgi:hypothetical protein
VVFINAFYSTGFGFLFRDLDFFSSSIGFGFVLFDEVNLQPVLSHNNYFTVPFSKTNNSMHCY